MSVVYVLLPLALLTSGAAVVAFLRALRSGQFDDLLTPAVRAVFDEPARADEPSRRAGAADDERHAVEGDDDDALAGTDRS